MNAWWEVLLCVGELFVQGSGSAFLLSVISVCLVIYIGVCWLVRE